MIKIKTFMTRWRFILTNACCYIEIGSVSTSPSTDMEVFFTTIICSAKFINSVKCSRLPNRDWIWNNSRKISFIKIWNQKFCQQIWSVSEFLFIACLVGKNFIRQIFCHAKLFVGQNFHQQTCHFQPSKNVTKLKRKCLNSLSTIEPKKDTSHLDKCIILSGKCLWGKIFVRRYFQSLLKKSVLKVLNSCIIITIDLRSFLNAKKNILKRFSSHPILGKCVCVTLHTQIEFVMTGCRGVRTIHHKAQ